MVRGSHPMAGGIRRFDDGGMVGMGGIGGISPATQTADPNTQNAIQRYASLPVEKLQELAARTQGTPQGQIVQRILAQKRQQPNATNAPPVAPTTAPVAPPGALPPQPSVLAQPQRRGGATQTRASGGDISPSEGSPWWSRAEASSFDRSPSGFLSGNTMGRADAVQTTSPAGSYIIPATEIANLGEGNSLAGARIMDEVLRSAPYGIQQFQQHGGRGLPHPVARVAESKGGGLKGGAAGDRVPVLLSHGEYEIHPSDVVRIGRGSLKRGHKILDAFVMHIRKKAIAKLKSLPGPVKAK